MLQQRVGAHTVSIVWARLLQQLIGAHTVSIVRARPVTATIVTPWAPRSAAARPQPPATGTMLTPWVPHPRCSNGSAHTP